VATAARSRTHPGLRKIGTNDQRIDPRLYQISVLRRLLSYGLIWLDFGVSWERITFVLAVCLAVQHICTRCWKVPRYNPRSALVSALSLCLLLRTGHPALAVLAAVVTIFSKFLIRVDSRHVFNPTNFGLEVTMLLTDQVWVSPGHWGSVAFFGFLLACLGVVVVNRSARSDVTYPFLWCYLAIVIGRTLWLGDPVSIAVHQLQNGELVLFAFFMISDPKTTPDSSAGQVLFDLLIAVGAAYVQLALFRPNGLLWSLVAVAMTVPVINRWLPGHRYTWAAPRDAHPPIDASALVTAT
jgi:Na+-transporting NADH:ubiquinone oxidoreductase subunit NqrB